MQNEQSYDTLKLPPHSLDAEYSVLGGLLLSNDALDKVADILNVSDFYQYEHRLIYEHTLKIINSGRPADIVTVAESLENASELASIGGIAYLANLVQNTPSAANIRRYAEIVRERSLTRQLIEVSTGITETAYNPQGRDIKNLLDDAEAKILKIAETGQRGSQGFIGVQQILPNVMNHIDDLYQRENQNGVTGTSTGFTDLDDFTSGFQAGDLIIVAGRPSMGKTAFSINIAENIALESKLPVAIFSMEMGASQLVTRMIGSIGKLDQQRMRNGSLEDEDWYRLTSAVGILNDAPIYIDEGAGLTAFDVRARARRLQRQAGQLGLIVIDYIQLMAGTSEKANENRATEISEISRALKSLAKELNVPVVALSQLNRSVEQRQDKRPVMSDLRESGAIEQDADLILFIYRDEVYNKDTDQKGTAEIIISKQRNGPIGTVRMTFLGEHTRFENYAGGYSGEY